MLTATAAGVTAGWCRAQERLISRAWPDWRAGVRKK
jgi:hypothetical protein